MNNPVGQRPVVGMYAFRSANPRRLASFWAEVMELPVSENSTDQLVMLDFDHQVAPVTWLFQLDTSASNASSRLSLDIGRQTEEGWREVADRAERAGAARKSEHELGGTRWIEMDDPDGNPFRVMAPRPT
ncbi:MAG TPA: VOC family protein [Micromonosporaceae bacterium]|nr:VOC family protein [Micromonosporaceae bacterium]